MNEKERNSPDDFAAPVDRVYSRDSFAWYEAGSLLVKRKATRSTERDKEAAVESENVGILGVKGA